MTDTARALVAPGKGILAADESTRTIEKRLRSISLESTQERRREYRDILFTTEGIGEFVGLPVADRSPYDRFMLSFHHFLKENRAFQDEGGKATLSFPGGSTWMVFTDMVSHAVLGGRYALEQTFIVSRASLALPDKAPIAILETIAGASLA